VCLAGECFARSYQFVTDQSKDETVCTGQSVIRYVVRLSALAEINAEATLSAALDMMFVSEGAAAHQYTL
jgi:hypothetical protein